MLSQSEMSNKYGLSSTVIGTYERGDRNPSVDFIQRFCKDFEINIDDFFNKDLSKVASADSYFVAEPSADYKKPEDNDASYQIFERLIQTKEQVIETQRHVIQTHIKTIDVITKQNSIYETLLNQNHKN